MALYSALLTIVPIVIAVTAVAVGYIGFRFYLEELRQ